MTRLLMNVQKSILLSWGFELVQSAQRETRDGALVVVPLSNANGFDVTDAECSALWSIGRVSEQRMVPGGM
jgi:hypothetical protein